MLVASSFRCGFDQEQGEQRKGGWEDWHLQHSTISVEELRAVLVSWPLFPLG